MKKQDCKYKSTHLLTYLVSCFFFHKMIKTKYLNYNAFVSFVKPPLKIYSSSCTEVYAQFIIQPFYLFFRSTNSKIPFIRFIFMYIIFTFFFLYKKSIFRSFAFGVVEAQGYFYFCSLYTFFFVDLFVSFFKF